MALTAIVSPILNGVLHGIKAEVAKEVGGHDNVKLMMLPRLYRPGDGDIGISFEYAVHEAIAQQDARVVDGINSSLKFCSIEQGDPSSILFGLEKTGAVQVIATARNVLNDESRALVGKVGQPPKLKKRLNTLAAALRRPSTRLALPSSIRGPWKADFSSEVLRPSSGSALQ